MKKHMAFTVLVFLCCSLSFAQYDDSQLSSDLIEEELLSDYEGREEAPLEEMQEPEAPQFPEGEEYDLSLGSEELPVEEIQE